MVQWCVFFDVEDENEKKCPFLKTKNVGTCTLQCFFILESRPRPNKLYNGLWFRWIWVEYLPSISQESQDSELPLEFRV